MLTKQLEIMKTIKVEIKGMTPLLLHNPRLANPLDPESKKHKEVSKKRVKSDDDHEWLLHHNWEMGFYLDKDEDVIIPSHMLEACIVNGAKDFKKGTQFKSTFMVLSDAKLKHSETGKVFSMQQMYKNRDQFMDVRPVKLKGSTTLMCARPKLESWSLGFEASYMEEAINLAEVQQAIENGGKYKAIGDYRPKFGRFEIVAITENKESSFKRTA